MNSTSPLESIFFAALEKHSPAERRAFLDEACAGDAELRGWVERMLAAQVEAGSFLEQPAMARNATVYHEPLITEQPGTVIGPYKLLQQIGEGGMGVVFMAEQTEPIQRTVALKIIKPGMDTRQVIARFEAERQAVAMMDHPNIARVLDAGTTETGRPYFVMDLVKGVPITEYCDQQHLTVRQRLELVTQVCHAVQHAHQKGIIHRDLKPSNVVVAEYDGKPVPKVIDFGVAKATVQRLTEKTMFTEYGQLIGTFEYMSPEQARFSQLDVDTRSDIYSLGVLLYELLVGSTPLEKQRPETVAFDETLRIIREEEPPPPSTRLSRSGLPSRTDPAEGPARQAGPTRLATIAANRHTEPARLSKDLRGELDWIVMKCLEKDRNRRYETASALASDITRYLNDEPVTAAAPSRLYRFVKFAKRNRGAVMTAAAVMAGLIAGVISLSMGLASQSRQRVAAEREWAETQLNLAAALQSLGKYDEAEVLYRQALARPSDAGPEARQRDARTRLRLAQAVRQQQGAAAAELLFREALTDYRAAFPEHDPNIAFALTEFAYLLRDGLHRYSDGEARFREVLNINRQTRPGDHFEIAKSLIQVGCALAWQQKFADAEPFYRESIEEYERGLPDGDPITALARMEYAYLLIKLDRLAEAEALLLQAESALRSNPPWRVYITAALTCLYTKRDQAEPGKGYDAKARQWTLEILDGYFKKSDEGEDHG